MTIERKYHNYFDVEYLLFLHGDQHIQSVRSRLQPRSRQTEISGQVFVTLLCRSRETPVVEKILTPL